jgi:hypothetical protein
MTQEMITQATSDENKTKTTLTSLIYILANSFYRLLRLPTAGTKQIFETDVIEGFGKALFDPTQVAYFGFSKLKDQCRISYDRSVEHELKSIQTTAS